MALTKTQFALPLLAARQASKHVILNEVLIDLKILMQPGTLTRGLTAPPAAPAEGDMHLVGAGPSGPGPAATATSPHGGTASGVSSVSVLR
jgi:hypothetical protein